MPWYIHVNFILLKENLLYLIYIYISNNITIVLVMSMLIESDFESCQNLKLSKFLHPALYISI